ncbi:MAG: hypothetical protein AcusKO_05670 [Acuticoccus sp.]
MTVRQTSVGAVTALAIALGAFGASSPASAAPLGAAKTDRIAEQTGIETVGRRGRHPGRHVGFNPAAAAALGTNMFLFGAAFAANTAPRRCRIVRVEEWSHRHQAHIVRRRQVCH